MTYDDHLTEDHYTWMCHVAGSVAPVARSDTGRQHARAARGEAGRSHEDFSQYLP